MYKKIAFAAVGVLVAASPFLVSAQTVALPIISPNLTVSQIQALIAELTQLLQQKLGQPSANVTLAASNPTPVPYSIVAGGTTGVIVGAFSLQPSGDNVNLQQIGLDLQAQQASPSDVSRAYIYQGATLVGTTIFTGSQTETCPSAFTGVPAGGCYFATTTISVSPALTQNTQTNFTIKADIGGIGTGMPGKAGDYIVIGLADAQGTGATSGAVVNSGSAPAQVGARIFKSYPIVTLVPPSPATISSGSNQVLMRYSITAWNGPIGILYQTFNASASGVATLSNLKLYGYADSAFSMPIAGQGSGGQIGTTTCVSGCAAPSLDFSFQPASSPFEFEIPAGTTDYFEVVGSVVPSNSAFSVVTTLLGDNSSIFPQASGQGHFVWSPNDNGTSQFSTADWSDGYGVLGLPVTGISQDVYGSGTTSPTPTPTPAPTPTPTPTPPPAPTISLSETTQRSISGNPFTIAWNSSNATSCSVTRVGPNVTNSAWGSGTSGSQVAEPTVVGQYQWTLTCTGAGGTATNSITHTVVAGTQADAGESAQLANAATALQAALQNLLAQFQQ
jgi:hypothetical protein